MSKLIEWRSAAMIVLVAALAGCGGGGGPDTTVAGGTGGTDGGGATTYTCPIDGKIVADPKDCATVTPDLSALAGKTIDPAVLVGSGITIPYSGAMKNDGITVAFTFGTNTVAGTGSIGIEGRTIVVKSAVTVPYGQTTVHFVVSAVDGVDRTVKAEGDFTTGAKTCTDSRRWSDPAVFTQSVADCVAPFSVQAIRGSAPAKSDACKMGMSDVYGGACLLDAAAGAFSFVNTGNLVADHAAYWVAFDSGGTSYVDLVDSVTLVVAVQHALPGKLLWIMGNPTGSANNVQVVVGAGTTNRIYEATPVGLTCLTNCP